MAGVNKAIIVGNLGNDPEIRYSANGNAIASISVATSDRWKDKTTGEQQERTEWHNVVCFARLGEIAGEYLRKGSKVYIEGQLRTSSWEAEGQKKYRTEINAREMQMLDSRGSMDGGGGQINPPPSGFDSAPAQAPAGMSMDNAPTLSDNNDFEDDIPF